MIEAACVVFGLIVGSFLSVCIYRIPLGNKDLFADESEQSDLTASPSEATQPETISVTTPARSFCPQCRAQLRWWHNIPVVSWVLLRGKCAFCKVPISARYPTVELMSGICAYLSYAEFGLTPTAAIVYLFSATLIVISFIDYDFYIIPNVISIPGTLLGLIVATVNEFTQFFGPPVAEGVLQSGVGILVGGGFLLFISEVYLRLRKREGLGMGDVKLLAMTGAFFGPQAALYTIFVGSLLGSILGLALILVFRKGLTHQLPFGPYLAFGTALYLFTGDRLLGSVAQLFGTM